MLITLATQKAPEGRPAPTAGRNGCGLVQAVADVSSAEGGVMKLLLTDSGVKNASMLAALVDLLGKPIAEAGALCIPTAGYGGQYGDPGGPWRFISGRSPYPMTELGWKSVGVLELTALPSIDMERWAVTRCTCATGCGSPDWPTSSRRCATRSTWGSVPGAWC
jgi:hypothetical protein